MSRTAHLCMAVASIGGLLLSACGLFIADRPASNQPRAAEAAPEIQRISQVDFGRNARFTSCMEPACPSVTPKTLASMSAPGTPVPIVAKPPTAASATVVPTPKDRPVATIPTSSGTAAPRKLILHFGTNSAVLTAVHKALLRNALNELSRADRIVIAGRTDDLGGEALNKALALARALAIRDHLLDLAPNLPARIAIDAKGRCCYTAPNDSNAGRTQNRRVELAYATSDEGAP